MQAQCVRIGIGVLCITLHTYCAKEPTERASQWSRAPILILQTGYSEYGGPLVQWKTVGITDSSREGILPVHALILEDVAWLSPPEVAVLLCWTGSLLLPRSRGCEVVVHWLRQGRSRSLGVFPQETRMAVDRKNNRLAVVWQPTSGSLTIGVYDSLDWDIVSTMTIAWNLPWHVEGGSSISAGWIGETEDLLVAHHSGKACVITPRSQQFRSTNVVPNWKIQLKTNSKDDRYLTSLWTNDNAEYAKTKVVVGHVGRSGIQTLVTTDNAVQNMFFGPDGNTVFYSEWHPGHSSYVNEHRFIKLEDFTNNWFRRDSSCLHDVAVIR